MYLTFIICLLLIPIISIIITGKVFNPPSIFLGISIFQVFLHLLVYGALNDDVVYIYVISSLCFFSFFFFVTYIFVAFFGNFIVPSRIKLKKINNDKLKNAFIIGCIISVLSIIFHAYVGISNGLSGGYQNFFQSMRFNYIYGESNFYIAPHMLLLSQVIFLFCIAADFKVKKSAVILIFSTISCAVFKFERMPILSIVFAIFVLINLKGKQGISFKWVFITLLGGASIFVFVAQSIGTNRTVLDALKILASYFSNQLNLFHDFVLPINPNGDFTLLLGRYAKHLGLDGSGLELQTDGSFNVYGYLRNVYLPFGISSIISFASLAGCVFGFLFYGAQRYLPLAVLYSLFSFTLFISMFDYTFMSTNYLYYSLFIFLFYFMLRIKLRF